MLKLSPTWGENEVLAQPTPDTWWGLSARELRDAFGAYATGVTLVTAQGPDGPVGITANSFTSISLDPPLLLVCVDRRARSLPAFERAESFAVNVLHADHEPLSNRFARPHGDGERFDHAGWTTGALGLPILADALAVFECRRHAVHEGGDHRIFLGRVEALRRHSAAEPLVVFQGAYRSLQAPEP